MQWLVLAYLVDDQFEQALGGALDRSTPVRSSPCLYLRSSCHRRKGKREEHIPLGFGPLELHGYRPFCCAFLCARLNSKMIAIGLVGQGDQLIVQFRAISPFNSPWVPVSALVNWSFWWRLDSCLVPARSGVQAANLGVGVSLQLVHVFGARFWAMAALSCVTAACCCFCTSAIS